MGSVDRFHGVRELEWGNNYSFVFTNIELKLAFHSIMNVGNKVIYGP